jgi:SAM-dependent methyltransferase
VPDDELRQLLDEQIAYYRARGPEYLYEVLDVLPSEITSVVDEFAPGGDVLELACGPGTWTPRLLRNAATVTAVDASPEMLAIARRRVGEDHRVRFVLADLFTWQPDRQYDGVFFGFWLSHVPLELFARFWTLVDDCLVPGGRVLFVDDAFRTPEELVEGPASSTIRRRLSDGSTHRAVKVPHAPDTLRRRLEALGWRMEVSTVQGQFFWGAGGRTGQVDARSRSGSSPTP